MDRRSLLLALPVLAASPGARAAPRGAFRPPPGVEAASNSVQISASTADARTGFVVRYCAYPNDKVAWVWVNVFHDGRIWTYTDDALPLDTPVPDLSGETVRYGQKAGARIDLVRHGPRGRPTRAVIDALFAAKPGGRVEHGRGTVPIQLRAEITPATANENNALMPDRSEAKGLVRTELVIAGKPVRFEGYGSWHEQPQSRPRFVEPFVYFRGSGDGVAFTFSQYRGDGAGGYLTVGDQTDPIKSFQISPQARVRRYRAQFASGRLIEGQVEEVYRFAIRIYDGWRESQIVRGVIDGKPYVGAINDFMGGKISYLPR